jgi:hypothetical protein
MSNQTSNNERTLIYAGSGTDVAPIVIGTCGYCETENFEKHCDAKGLDNHKELIDIFESVDRFVFLDIAPYCEFPELNGRRLSGTYPSIDHFVKFWEVYCNHRFYSDNFVHHEEEAYFEMGINNGMKTFEYHYGVDFFNVDPDSRISQLMKSANIVYQQGWMPEDEGANAYYTAFPNADTIMFQHTLRNELEFYRFEDASKLDTPIKLVFHPSHRVSMYD